MVKSLRLGTALTAIGMFGALAACATPGARMATRASIFGDKVDRSNIGIATRAQIAVEKGDYATAVTLAERAVGNTPNDAGFRALLGNAYFGSGRFASAESAYRDSLSLLPGQPQVVLKLALVTIAQGKTDSAIAVLEGARGVLDPSDYGLALALAGQPQAAVNVLDAAAREVGADSRVRQNLALAHALAGDWTQARTVASQDVAADQLDSRSSTNRAPTSASPRNSRPPIASASWRAIASPSPVPSARPVTKGSNSQARNSGATPGPVSATMIRSTSPSTPADSVTVPPAGVWCRAF